MLAPSWFFLVENSYILQWHSFLSSSLFQSILLSLVFSLKYAIVFDLPFPKRRLVTEEEIHEPHLVFEASLYLLF